MNIKKIQKLDQEKVTIKGSDEVNKSYELMFGGQTTRLRPLTTLTTLW